MFSRYKFYLLENLENEISLYDSYIHQRYEDENIDASRPLINPNDSFVDKDILKSFCSKDKIIKEVNNYTKPKFDDFNSLLNLIDDKKTINQKIILITSIQSEYELLIKKFSPNINEILDIEDANNSINLMLSNIVMPIDLKERLVCHKEYYENVNISLPSENSTNSSFINKDILFKEGDYVIHENYGLGLYSGLEIVSTNNISNEYMKIIYLSNEALYVPLRRDRKSVV